MKNYRSVEVRILGKDYRYKVDEPEEIINKILKDIKIEAEEYAKKIGEEEIDYILLLMLLNERLNTLKTKQEINELITKFNNTLTTTLNPQDEKTWENKTKSVHWD
ncbi:cell division protein ZapA [Petrotoga sp. 9PWA.NaAc.5.4]|uniref:cell division protein ZapA n=1 Tax=Petrotoga sp. 9PWA.NaAc.5.4 TaxID=1434328 RepID=UPI000CB17855|nr:cell division protein ZapA [Petrotoga sp. 9PWA.NaAc.5.4]PNR94348.1 hypothetical protein X924_06750 [Petrotoga sp. 9PWA.NaAc.5.4]